MKISVIIPVLNEENTINRTISHLFETAGKVDLEVIVVDGSSTGNTLKVVESPKVKKIMSPPGRGVQMNKGAEISNGEILLFLHSDTILPTNAFDDILQTMEDNYELGAFDICLDGRNFFFRIIEKAANLRSRITKTPFGDQAIFIKRDLFFSVGGYKEIPIMEDIDFIRRVRKKSGGIKILKRKVITSSRRWEKEGLLRCTLRNWMILLMYFSGVSPSKIKEYYR